MKKKEVVSEVQEVQEVQVEQVPAAPTQFTFKLQASYFESIVKAVNAIVSYDVGDKETPEIMFQIREDGIKVNKLSKSKTALVSFALGKKGFEDYSCQKTGSLCFNCTDLLSVLKGVKAESKAGDGTIRREGDMLNLAVTDPDMKLELSNSEYTRTFTLKAIEPEDGDIPAEVKADLPTMFKTSVKNFKQIIEDASKTGEHIRITATQEGVSFSNVAEDTSMKYEGALPKTEKLDELEVKKDSKATYSLDFLKNIINNIPKEASTITIRFGTDQPIKIETGLFDKLDFWMSPRIETH